MKVFLDSVDCAAIAQWSKIGIIDGITTNPTLLSRGSKNPKKTILEICSLLSDKVVNVEIVEKEPRKIYAQARAIFDLADNIVVKIPCHKDYYEVIKKLVSENISLNITLVFSLAQGLMMSKLGVDYISPFVGRLEDNGGNGIELLTQLCAMKKHYEFSTNILAASIRTVDHFAHAIIAGADIATVSVKMLELVAQHPLTDQGIVQFLDDWKTANITDFL